MKKIFTLIAMAVVAMSVNAQEKLVFDASATYTDNQELTTASTKFVLGNDQKNANWTVNQSALVKEANANLLDFFQTITTDEGEKEGYVSINGGNNPKDKKGKNSGSGFNAADGKSLGNLPQSGTYFMLTANAAGQVKAGIILNADKEFYLVDGTGATADETGEYMQVVLPDANMKNYVIKNGAGETVELIAAEKGGVTIGEKVVGTLEFAAEAGHTYYFFCTGSKLGCFGYVFTAGAAGISNVKADSSNGAIYNLAGQQVNGQFKGVAIKDGKKVILK